MEAIATVKTQAARMQLIAGNVATYEGASDLIALGVDAIKVGIGPGSICTTRVVTGAGVPQITAICECAGAPAAPASRSSPMAASSIPATSPRRSPPAPLRHDRHPLRRHRRELRAKPILYQGRTFKTYRGMGSLGAMAQGSSERYFQALEGDGSSEFSSRLDNGDDGNRLAKLVPEGIEGRVPFRGTVGMMVHQLVGGLRSGMGYVGCA